MITAAWKATTRDAVRSGRGHLDDDERRGERPPANSETRTTMKMMRFIFLIALSCVVLGLGGGPAAPPPGGPAARRVIIFVWDGLRADDVTPENMPHYFALGRSGLVFADHATCHPPFTR